MALAPDDTLSPANKPGQSLLAPRLQFKRLTSRGQSRRKRFRTVTALSGRPGEFAGGLFNRGSAVKGGLKPPGKPTKFGQRFFAGVGVSLQPAAFNVALARLQGFQGNPTGGGKPDRRFQFSTRKLSDEGALIVPDRTALGGPTKKQRKKFF